MCACLQPLMLLLVSISAFSAMLSGSAGTPRVVLKSTTELPEESVAQETIER